MNNQGSNSGQTFRLVILAFVAIYMWQSFTAKKNQGPPVPARPVPTLAEAFKGIDSSQGPLLTAEAGQAEVKTLQAKIAAEGHDEYAYWARLRVGLIQQYTLKNLEMKARPPSVWRSLFGALSYTPPEYTIYDEITDHGAINAIDAQALFQKGNWLWDRSIERGDKAPSHSAAYTLEQLIHKGRGSSAFLDLKIYAPVKPAAGSGAAATGAPVTGTAATGTAATGTAATATTSSAAPLSTIPQFRLVTVRDLRQTQPGSGLPEGILERVNEYHKTTFFYQMFDTVVSLLGKNPAYSYGIAILFFAIITRLLIQPLTRKQYESMKGMQVIAPEMKKIQDKYKGKSDQQAQVQMMKEIRELQARHGVNPMMGCALALVQMPLFFFFVYPLIQHYEPQLELAGASFLWIGNLAQPDIALLIMYGISMFLSFRLSSTPPTDEQQKMMQTMMAFMMPVFFPFVLKTYPSAFVMYWMTFNMVSTFFQWRLMKAADPNKSIIKSLMGTGEAPVVDAVPDRPGGKGEGKGEGKKDGKTETRKEPVKASAVVPARPSQRGARNGELNGLNGKAHSNGLNGSSVDGVAGVDGAADGLEAGATTAPNKSQPEANRNNSQRARRRRRH